MTFAWPTHQNVNLLIRTAILIYVVAKRQVMAVNLKDQKQQNTNAAD